MAELQARLDEGEVITGTGYTVSRGGTPEPFEVEVLGIQRHWFLPGRHIIVVETASPALDKAGGVWAGMSGSPIFDTADGRLIGGLAWGFTWGPSKLAGLTPAQELLDLLAYPRGGGPAAAAVPPTMPSGTLSGGLAGAVKERDPAAGTRLEPLRLPVPIANARAVDVAQDYFAKQGLPLLAVPGGGGTGTAAVVAPQPGGNFAAALSYGDNAFYASGTTTFVCDEFAVAFAHWFTASGRTVMGANAGHTITVADDPVFGPFKMMNLGGQVGTLDQDRFAGVRAALGVAPPTAEIRTALTDADTDRSTAGTTAVVYERALPFIAAMHLWDATDGTLDRWGPGTSTLTWTVTGTRADGSPWSFTRDNLFASHWDIGFDSFWELWSLLTVLQVNDLERVSLDTVDIGGSFEEAVRRARLGEVHVSVDGGPFEPAQHGFAALPGSTLDLKVGLAGHPEVALSLRVPDDAAGFVGLRVTGGGASFDEHVDEEPTPGHLETFDELLAALDELPRNNEVVAELVIGEFWEEDLLDGHGLAAAAEGLRDRVAIDRVVTGELFTEVFVDDGGEPGPPSLHRLAGSDRVATAVAVSQHSHPEPGVTDTVLLARADDYADALAGAPLAAGAEAPLLLTRREAVPQPVVNELDRLGASRVVLLGGTAAISEGVADELADAGLAVERIDGVDRFDTARRIAERVGGDSAYLVLGHHPERHRGWADALTVSGLAAAQQRPILLTAADRLPGATREALARMDAVDVTVVGGSAAVPDHVVAAVRAAGPAVARLAGATRYETSLAVAQRAVDSGAHGGRVWLATGRDFPDALAAGPAVVADGGVLLLVDGLGLERSPAVATWLDEHHPHLEHVILVGGAAAISDDVEHELRAIIEVPSADTP